MAAVLAALAAPAAAGAHSVVRVSSGELSSLSADATSLNTLTARMRGSRVVLRDPTVDGGMDIGSCDPGDIDNNGFTIEAFCPRAGLRLVRLDVGDREDRVTAKLPVRVLLLGGEGADRLLTGPADDTILGEAGDDDLGGGAGRDTLGGGPGADVIAGGPGDDSVRVRDGVLDEVRCDDGDDTVDADTLDKVAADCEDVTRTATAPPAGGEGGPDRTAPQVQAGGPTRQRLGRRRSLRVVATTSERGTVAASGALYVGGAALPLLSRREQVAVGGGGATLEVPLSRSQLRQVRRALRRGRRVTARLTVVATDAAGNSAQTRPPRIRVLR